VSKGDGYSVANLDDLGEGPGFRNLSESEQAVYVVVGGKDGYVGRDGKMPEGENNPR